MRPAVMRPLAMRVRGVPAAPRRPTSPWARPAPLATMARWARRRAEMWPSPAAVACSSQAWVRPVQACAAVAACAAVVCSPVAGRVACRACAAERPLDRVCRRLRAAAAVAARREQAAAARVRRRAARRAGPNRPHRGSRALHHGLARASPARPEDQTARPDDTASPPIRRSRTTKGRLSGGLGSRDNAEDPGDDLFSRGAAP